MTLEAAKKAVKNATNKRQLILLSSNAKLEKPVPDTLIIGLQAMAENENGRTTCAYARKNNLECLRYCLKKSGNARFDVVQNCRQRKTDFYFEDREAFEQTLFEEICFVYEICRENDVKLAVRLNVLTDLPFYSLAWRIYDAIGHVPDFRLYDYTKDTRRISNQMKGLLPPMDFYHLTLSDCETRTMQELTNALENGYNVATIKGKYNWEQITEKSTNGIGDYEILNGDENDARYLHKGCIVEIGFKRPTTQYEGR